MIVFSHECTILGGLVPFCSSHDVEYHAFVGRKSFLYLNAIRLCASAHSPLTLFNNIFAKHEYVNLAVSLSPQRMRKRAS